MLIAFANNQSLTAIEGSDNVIQTDPIPMGGSDRVSLMTNIHTLIVTGGATATVGVVTQASNDGVHWDNIGVNAGYTAASSGSPEPATADIQYGYLRLQFTLAISNGSGSDWGTTTFDCHARIWKV